MKTKDIVWEDENNIMVFYNGDHKVSFGIKDIEHFKKALDDKRLRFYHINSNKRDHIISINLDNIKSVVYKEKNV